MYYISDFHELILHIQALRDHTSSTIIKIKKKLANLCLQIQYITRLSDFKLETLHELKNLLLEDRCCFYVMYPRQIQNICHTNEFIFNPGVFVIGTIKVSAEF